MPFKDPVRAREYAREYREKNLERLRAQRREKYLSDPEAQKAQARAWRAAHPERYAKFSRNWTLRNKYGIEPEDYDALFEAQGGVCAICGEPDRDPNRKYLSVDHDHDTGAVRGLLCQSCNVALGHLNDDPDLMLAAAFYVLRSRDVLALETAVRR